MWNPETKRYECWHCGRTDHDAGECLSRIPMNQTTVAPLMRIYTRNSIYQVDTERRRVRRLCGVNPPTTFFGTDGEWRDFSPDFSLSLAVGQSVYFFATTDIFGRSSSVRTSTVLAMEPDDEEV